MADEITITQTESTATEQPTNSELVEQVQESAEQWQTQFSEGVRAMLDLVTEVRAANSETQTLRQQVSELLQTNRELTAQLAAQSQTATMAAQSTLTTLAEVVATQTPLTDGSRTESQESIQEEVELTETVSAAAVETPVEQMTRKRRRI